MANSNDGLRTEQITLNVEPVVAEAFRAVCKKDGATISTYGRKLILQELMRRELLPHETLVRLAE